jgi:fluoroacetyl-CoA thioesterase
MDSPIEHELHLTVTPEMAAPHLGPAGAVLSTPSMIGVMEQCCRQALVPYTAPGDQVIGVAVCITHEAACRVGDGVLVRARQQAADGARHTWDVSVVGADGRRIGAGTLTTEVRTTLDSAR